MAQVLQFPVDTRDPLIVLDRKALFADLEAIGLGAWRDTTGRLLDERLADGAHGDLDKWQRILDALPDAAEAAGKTDLVRELLLQLAPWRKGPFDVHGITIDAEWRSDMKWSRLAGAITALAGRNILDVGCGNGFYALKMLEAGAGRVIGIDPTLLFVAQFEAIRRLTGITGAHVLPLRLEELPQNARAFDTTFSMGVLYHRREPAAHLRELRGTLRSGGELVLETLILPGESLDVLKPASRYARMRNVWHLPTLAALGAWLDEAGFVERKLVDVSTTTVEEQRSTEWMPFESLAEALDPDDPTRTIEGLPAPTRAIIVCRNP